MHRRPALAAFFWFAGIAAAADPGWVASWTAAVHGPFPSGNAVGQPDLRFAFAGPSANDQTFRLIIRPDQLARRVRLRFSNVLGSQTVSFDNVFVGLQESGPAIVHSTNRRVTFAHRNSLNIPAGQSAYSDAIDLNFLQNTASWETIGRKLAVSFHVVAEAGPMTWHAKAMQTSYLTAPKSGAHSGEESGDAFLYSTTSWYFLDALEVFAPAGTEVIAAFGDSITDGTGSTLNGDDRWPDALARRLHAAYGTRVSVVNLGIGGNRVAGPAYSAANPVPGGPTAVQRLERDVLSVAGLTHVIWLEGINDFSQGGPDMTPETVIAGYKDVVGRLHARGVKVMGATLTSSLHSTNAAAGSVSVDQRRKVVNEFIRHGGLFDAVADFDAATVDPATGGLRLEFRPDSALGGPGDGLHPNRAGYQAMANAIDLTWFARSAEGAAKK
jgi:lysophospholipase L1-like esterase